MARQKSSPAALEAPQETTAIAVKCFYDMVLIRPDKKSDRTAGGIMLPDSARQQQTELKYGVVVSAGPGKQVEANGLNNALPFAEGDRVVYQLGMYGGGVLEIGGESLDLVGAANVYCTC